MISDEKKQRGSRVRTLRKSAGLTLNQLAADIGIKYQAVIQWERGQTSPSADNIAKLSLRFGVHPTWLWTGQGPEEMAARESNDIKAAENGAGYRLKNYPPHIKAYMVKLAEILQGGDEQACNAIKANIDTLYRYHVRGGTPTS